MDTAAESRLLNKLHCAASFVHPNSNKLPNRSNDNPFTPMGNGTADAWAGRLTKIAEWASREFLLADLLPSVIP